MCCLRASQARLRAVLRVCAPSSALSRAPVHAARGDVRLVGRGGRGEVRGRDACATGWRGEARDISAFTCAYLGTPCGSGRDLGRFGHVWEMLCRVVWARERCSEIYLPIKLSSLEGTACHAAIDSSNPYLPKYTSLFCTFWEPNPEHGVTPLHGGGHASDDGLYRARLGVERTGRGRCTIN